MAIMIATTPCPGCGFENKETAKTCKKCGRDMTVPPTWQPDAAWHLKTLAVIYAALTLLYFGATAILSKLPKPYQLRDIPVEMTPWLAPGGKVHLPEEQLKAPPGADDAARGALDEVRPVCLAAAALAATACAAACAPTAAPPPRADRRQTIEGLTLNQSDRGQPGWTLRSSVALLHEEENTADLDTPTMDFYKDGRISSRVTARYGVVATDTHDVHLSSSVVVDSLEDHSVLTTEALVYSSKTRLFHTDLDVIVHRPEGVSYGRGMDATPDLSEVRIYKQHSILSGKSR